LELECYRTFRKIDNKFIGKWMKEKLTSLGPTFVKIGQFMSTRKDIFGEDFTNELKELQDNVSPFDFHSVVNDINIDDDFTYVDPIPIASASIGQVHKATLSSGEDVIIKIKRPGITQTIKDDFELVLLLFNLFRKVFDSQRVKEIEILFQEYYRILVDEIDFKKEKSNMKRFSKMFAGKKWIKIPYVYDDLSNDDIITMEYVPSIKIDNVTEIDKLKFNRGLIADKLIETFIVQIIDNGFVHIDPHPGNLGITPNGKIVFYDFGMVLSLDKKIKDNFNTLLLAIYEKDVNDMCNIALDLGIVSVESSDIASFKSFLFYFISYLDTLDVSNFKLSYLDKVSSSQVNFMLSSKFIMLSRGITILEGICKELDPNFTYMRTLEPYINKYMVNLDYIEKKAQKDFMNMRGENTKISKTEVQLDMLQGNINQINRQLKEKEEQGKVNYALTIGVMFILILQYIK
jgi:predicted unusual protein kinase regulating ubiquinone biosynthesis (AarF/ABC1/UbiB family)